MRKRTFRMLAVSVVLVAAGVVGVQLAAGAAGGDPRPPVRPPTFTPPIFPPTQGPGPLPPLPTIVRVPDLIGQELGAAMNTLGDAGLVRGRLSFQQTNHDCNRPELVIAQSPGPGTVVTGGTAVDITTDVLTFAAC